MLKHFGDLSNVHIYVDNIIIASQNLKTITTLEIFFRKVIHANLMLNLDKIRISEEPVKFLIIILSNKKIISYLGVANRLFQDPHPSIRKELQRLLLALEWCYNFILVISLLYHPLIK